MALINAEFSARITTLANSAIANAVFPCLEILVAHDKEIVFHRTFGTRIPDDPTTPLHKNALFDLASLTKPLATSLAILHLCEHKMLSLNDPLRKHLPEFKTRGVDEITIRHLLTHTAGFPDWVALFLPQFDPIQGWKKLLATNLVYPPGEKTLYSCLGFIILAEIVRRLTQKSLNDYCCDSIYRPLDLHHLAFNPLQNLSSQDLELVPTGYCDLRQLNLNGIVHDENAALFNGEGGNAGLFGTAENIHRLSTLLITEQPSAMDSILSAKSRTVMASNHNPPPLEPRALGWDYKQGKADYWSCSDLMPEGSIGHLGFTGTSLWMDPCSKLIILLLSNRVVISRDDTIPLMRVFRQKMHSLILSAVATGI